MDENTTTTDPEVDGFDILKIGGDRGWLADADNIDASGNMHEVLAFLQASRIDGPLERARVAAIIEITCATTPFVGVHARRVPNPGDLGGDVLQLAVASFEKIA